MRIYQFLCSLASFKLNPGSQTRGAWASCGPRCFLGIFNWL